MNKKNSISCLVLILALLNCACENLSAEENEKPVPLKVLMSINADGTGLKEIFRSDVFTGLGTPKVSYDGKKIAFDAWQAHLGENYRQGRIVIINIDGTGLQDLSDGNIPSWSPDGKKLVFSRYDLGEGNENNRGVWTMNSDGTNLKQIDKDGWSGIWSPDGTKIAYLGGYGQYFQIYDVKTQKSSELEFPIDDPYNGIWHNFCWSPDSRKVCFRGRKQPKLYEIASLSIDGKTFDIHYSHEKLRPMHTPAWHPKENKILFASRTETDKKIQLHWVDPVDASKDPELIPGQDYQGNSSEMCWTPDGKKIIFSVRLQPK